MTVSIGTAAISLLVGSVTLGVGAAPGWREFRWFSVIAFSAALYTAADVLVAAPAHDTWVTWGSRVNLLSGGLHCCAWLAYMASQDRRALTRGERVLAAVALGFAALALVPNVLITGRVEHHTDAWLEITYNDAQPTLLGGVCFVSYCGLFVLPLKRYVTKWRRGVPGAAAHALAMFFLCAAAVNDALAAAMVVATPYLLSSGFLVVVGVTASGLVRRLVTNARALQELSSSLERQVEARTSELGRAHEALMRAERLAALGRLVGGVAHEINNPAVSLVANLEYLSSCTEAGGAFPEDGAECLAEAGRATQRIVRVAQQLLDAGGGEPSRQLAQTCSVGRSLEASALAARVLLSEEIRIAVDAPSDLEASAAPPLVETVLESLIVNAGQAIQSLRASGTIRLGARAHGERVVVTVADDGPGIPAAVQPHIFDPYFTTKGVGQGSGLGLSVSQGLLRAVGGDVRLEATSPAGTVMAVELPGVSRPSARAQA